MIAKLDPDFEVVLKRVKSDDGPMYLLRRSSQGKMMGYDKVKPNDDGVLVPTEDRQMTFDEVCEMEQHNGMVQLND